MRLVDSKKVNPYIKYKSKNGVKLEGVNPVFNDYFSTLPDEYQDMILITEGMDTINRKNKSSKHYTGNAIDLRIHDKINGGYNDKLYNFMINDPNFEKFGFKMARPDHGTAPHIHISYLGDNARPHDDHNHSNGDSEAVTKNNTDTFVYDNYNDYIRGSNIDLDLPFIEATIDEIYGRDEEEAEKKNNKEISTNQKELTKEKEERNIYKELVNSLDLGFYSDNQT